MSLRKELGSPRLRMVRRVLAAGGSATLDAVFAANGRRLTLAKRDLYWLLAKRYLVRKGSVVEAGPGAANPSA